MVSRLTRNLKLTIAYDGAPFSGWQVQPERATIQGELAVAIKTITGEEILPQGSGRTDAGVHALAQVATWQTESKIPGENMVKALNGNLPPTIRVLAVEEVPLDFHPRRSAAAKTYRYRILRSAICSPFLVGRVWHYPYPLNEREMMDSAPIVTGRHDFTSFAAVDPDRTAREGGSIDNIREIYTSSWTRGDDELVYEVRGTGFLHHMVRNLVGTFLLVGKGTLHAGELDKIIAAKSRSANTGTTAPPGGLYLVNVEY